VVKPSHLVHRASASTWMFWLMLVAALAALAALPDSVSAQTPRRGARSSTPDFAAHVLRETAVVVSIVAMRTAGEAEGDDDPDADVFDDGFDPAILPGPDAWAGVPRLVRSLASGFVIASDGYILTSAHAVSSLGEATVRLADNRQFSAWVIGLDRLSDVALIKIDAVGLPVATIGNPAELAVGEWVAAIGAPFGLARSVTAGIVSAMPRYLPDIGGVPFIQTDVALNRGSSGGPLFNLRGEVVGVNTMIASQSGTYVGVSFTLPIDVAMQVATELRQRGHVTRSRLGVRVQEVTPELAASFELPSTVGALIVHVDGLSPAQRAGLKAGDIVLGSDERRDMTSAEVQQLVSAARPGSRLALNVWRQGRVLRIVAETVEVPPDPTGMPRDFGEPRDKLLGLQLGEVSAAERRALKTESGVRVIDVRGPALRAGIRPHDLILAVNEFPVSSVAEFEAVLAGIPIGRAPALLVQRSGAFNYIAVRPQPPGRASP
jgi:serine protease Do